MAKPRLPAGRGFPTAEEIVANPNPVRVEARGTKKGRKSEILLALDLSSTCIGWAVGENPRIVNYGKFVFTDEREMGERLMAFVAYLRAILRTYQPTRVLVEKPVSRRGQTTALHNQILGVVRLVVLAETGFEVLDKHLISPTTVKNALGLPTRNQGHSRNKQNMVEHCNEVLGLRLKFHENSKLQTDDDTADALGIILAQWTPKKAMV